VLLKRQPIVLVLTVALKGADESCQGGAPGNVNQAQAIFVLIFGFSTGIVDGDCRWRDSLPRGVFTPGRELQGDLLRRRAELAPQVDLPDNNQGQGKFVRGGDYDLCGVPQRN
jgi:hypothetical protein